MSPTNSASSRQWRVAIAGLGHWYSAYGLARALQEYPRATLVGAAWSDASQLEEFAGTFGVEAWTDYDAIFARDDVDIVQISAPVDEIPELTIRAARAGKHLILGKPPAMTLAQMDRMVEAVETSAITCVPFQASMRLRFASLKARLDRGDIGALVVLHQTARWSIAEDWFRSGTPGWFVDPAHVPGGAFIDEGIYWLDAVRWLTGSEVVEIDARMDNLVHKDLAVEDWGLAMLKMANGVHATLEAAWTINSPRVSGPSPSRTASSGSRRSARAVKSPISGSARRDARCWRRAPTTGCSSGNPKSRSPRHRR